MSSKDCAQQAYVAIKGARCSRELARGEEHLAEVNLNQALMFIKTNIGMSKERALKRMVENHERKLEFLKDKLKEANKNE